MITGFQAMMEVDDAGTGQATAGASTRFKGLTTFNLPALEAGSFDATELDQDDGATPTPAADPYEREEPTGLIKVGPTKCEIKYTVANYTRLQALCGKRGKTFKLKPPADQAGGTNANLTVEFVGFVKKVDEVKFEKGNPVMIPFELVCSKQPKVTPAT